MNNLTCDQITWLVAQLKPNQDKIAIRNLKNQGFEIFQPLRNITKRRNDKFVQIMAPLFPGYIFISVNMEKKNWQKVNSTVGITRLISFGQTLAFINNELIDEMKNQFPAQINLQPIDKFDPGKIVKINYGPFTELIGKIEKAESTERIWVLLNLLGNLTRVSVHSKTLSSLD